MFSRKRKDEPPPAWAGFLTSDNYRLFMQIVDDYFLSEDIDYAIAEAAVEVDDDRFGATSLGLQNIAQSCHLADPEEWPAMVKNHFDGLQRINVFQEEFDSKAHDFEYAAAFLAVRLYHESYMEQIEDYLGIGQHIADDIYAALVFDLPESVTNVRPEQAVLWNKTNEELFEIGVKNVFGKYPFDIIEETLDDIRFLIINEDHFYTGNVLFVMENYPMLQGSYGSLVSIPTRHAILFYPIENKEVLEAIRNLIPITCKMNEEGPGSISSQLYWYHEEELTLIPYELRDDQLEISPPEPFIELLDRLENMNDE